MSLKGNPEIIYMPNNENDNQAIIDDTKAYIRYDKYKALKSCLKSLKEEVELRKLNINPNDNRVMAGRNYELKWFLKLIKKALSECGSPEDYTLIEEE